MLEQLERPTPRLNESAPLTSLNDEERAALARLLDTLDEFRLMRATMSIHELSAFIRVGLDEGNNVKHYAQVSGVHPSLMSKHLSDLGVKARNGEQGLNLVEPRKHHTNLRDNAMVLTVKGRALLHKMAKRLSKSFS